MTIIAAIFRSYAVHELDSVTNVVDNPSGHLLSFTLLMSAGICSGVMWAALSNAPTWAAVGSLRYSATTRLASDQRPLMSTSPRGDCITTPAPGSDRSIAMVLNTADGSASSRFPRSSFTG